MDIENMGILSLEAAGSLLIFVLAIKLYKAKIVTSSGCCGDRLHISTENKGTDALPFEPHPAIVL